jgi:hypothetical protein
VQGQFLRTVRNTAGPASAGSLGSGVFCRLNGIGASASAHRRCLRNHGIAHDPAQSKSQQERLHFAHGVVRRTNYGPASGSGARDNSLLTRDFQAVFNPPATSTKSSQFPLQPRTCRQLIFSYYHCISFVFTVYGDKIVIIRDT